MRLSAAIRPAVMVALAFTLVIDGGMAGSGIVHAQTVTAAPIDPPSRVGRVARLLGTVSFHSTDQTDWLAATTNYPVTSGNAFWTEPSSAVEIDIAATHLALDQSTEFDIETLDDHVLQATQPQGSLFLRVLAVSEGDLTRIATPRGAVVITQPGIYEIVAGDADHPTLVTVIEGGARIDSTNASLTIGPRQTGRISGDTSFAASVGAAIMDPFLTARLEQDRQIARNLTAGRVQPPKVIVEMTGGQALNSAGIWATSGSYGQIWYPPVQASWVPYRDGHWGYVAPWGWTWIDDAPWGFAPFHYGRWVKDGPRWGWVPVERGAPERVAAAPVYAPALVSFISVGVALTQGQGRDRNPSARDGRGSVGWVPLGPRETYVPPYRASDRYVRAVNVSNVTNVTNITNITNVTNVTTVGKLVNRNGVTVVPVAAMATSQPVATLRQQVTAQSIADAKPQRAVPVQPTTATVGVTREVAKELNLAAPATPVPPRRAAPGPVVPPAPAVPVVVQSQVKTSDRPTPAIRPGGPHAPASISVLPVAALPVSVALPTLRAATPQAQAHPQAAGIVVNPPAVPPASKAAPASVGGAKPIVPAPSAPTPNAAKPIIPSTIPVTPPSGPTIGARVPHVPAAARPTLPAAAPAPVAPTPPIAAAPIGPTPSTGRPAPRSHLAPEAAKPALPPAIATQPAPPRHPAPEAAKPVVPPAIATQPALPPHPAPEAAKPAALPAIAAQPALPPHPAPEAAKPAVPPAIATQPAPPRHPAPEAARPVVPPAIAAQPALPPHPAPEAAKPALPPAIATQPAPPRHPAPEAARPVVPPAIATQPAPPRHPAPEAARPVVPPAIAAQPALPPHPAPEPAKPALPPAIATQPAPPRHPAPEAAKPVVPTPHPVVTPPATADKPDAASEAAKPEPPKKL